MPVETGMISDEEAEAMAAGEAVPAGVVVDPEIARHPETPQVDTPAPAPAPTVSTVSPDEVLDSAAAQTGPPPEVAGLEVLEAEKAAQDTAKTDTHPTAEIRGKRFRLRRKVPGWLLLRLTKTQVEVSRPANAEDQEKQSEAMAAVYDAILKLVHEPDQPAFEKWMEDADPEIELEELMQDVLKKMLEAVTGHPTQSASA